MVESTGWRSKYIRRTVAERPGTVVTAEKFNELFNVTITAVDNATAGVEQNTKDIDVIEETLGILPMDGGTFFDVEDPFEFNGGEF